MPTKSLELVVVTEGSLKVSVGALAPKGLSSLHRISEEVWFHVFCTMP